MRPDRKKGRRAVNDSGGPEPQRPLRILFLSAAELLSDHLPLGEGLIAHRLLTSLADRGHAVVAFCDRADMRETPAYEIVELASRRHLKSLWPYTRLLRSERALHRLGGAAGFDAVHWLRPYSARMITYGRAARASRTIVGPLGLSWPEGKRRGRRVGDLVAAALQPFLDRRYLRALQQTDTILLTLPAVTEEIPQELRRKTVVTGMAVDTNRFTASEIPADPVILFLGSLTASKRPLDLLEAFALARPRVASARLIFAGDGSLADDLRRRVAELGVGAEVDIRAAVPSDEVPALLVACSVVCVPSVGEPFGMAFLEAMAAGRAVIGVDLAGPRHLIDEGVGGRRVPPRDPAALAEALVEILSDADVCASMGRANRAKTEREFALDGWTDRLEHVYRGAPW